MRISAITISTLSLSLSLSLLGGCLTGEEAEQQGTEAPDIIGGSVDPYDPSVVMLRAVLSIDATSKPTGWSGCTATAISPWVLLTAAHCYQGKALWNDVFQGTSADPYSRATASTNYATVIPSPLYDGDPTKGHDVAIVLLSYPLAHYARRAPTPVVGSTVISIGYGNDTFAQTGFGTKRRIQNTVSAVTPTTFAAGYEAHNICHGDSGGPTVQSGGIVGVNDFVDTSDCHGGGHFARIDINLGFIHQYVPTF